MPKNKDQPNKTKLKLGAKSASTSAPALCMIRGHPALGLLNISLFKRTTFCRCSGWHKRSARRYSKRWNHGKWKSTLLKRTIYWRYYKILKELTLYKACCDHAGMKFDHTEPWRSHFGKSTLNAGDAFRSHKTMGANKSIKAGHHHWDFLLRRSPYLEAKQNLRHLEAGFDPHWDFLLHRRPYKKNKLHCIFWRN